MMQRIKDPLAVYVQRGSPEACWPWSGSKTKGGYGTVRGTTAHRFAYEAAHSPIPDGLNVLHNCDNPPCCNPAHLRLGTQQENIAEMHAKGRSGKPRVLGEAHHKCKLSDRDVRTIKMLYCSGLTQERVARIFGVWQSQVGRIIRGENRTAV